METDEGTGEEECGGMKWSNTLNLILLFMLGLWCALIIKTAPCCKRWCTLVADDPGMKNGS